MISMLKKRQPAFIGGVHPPQHKTESNGRPIVDAVLPQKLILPLDQHIGDAAKAVVAVGDRVLKGQVIAIAKGYVSAPVHAPSSGVVTAIDEHPIPHPSGLTAQCIVIAVDGEDQWIEHQPVKDYRQLEASVLRNIIREAGIVGLGGAGFPTFIKMNPGPGKRIDTLILNGVECEPYITCDDRLMREQAAEIISGAEILIHALQAKICVIAIEDNKPEAIAAMQSALAQQAGSSLEEKIEVRVVPTIYPHGSEKQLVRAITGKEVPRNGLAAQIGVVCQNVATAVAVFDAIHKGQPLISRVVTVTGGAVKKPVNLRVRFGTPMVDLLKQCECDLTAIKRLIMGGPMMGFTLHSENMPVIKTTNCLLAAALDNVTDQLLQEQTAMPCIRCGACADACPVSLLPQQLYWHARADHFEKAQEYNLFDCIECGCCSYVCPSNIPLVQYYRYAKTEIWDQEREKKKSDIARQRFEFRESRIERDKAEREERHRKKKEALVAKRAAAALEKSQAEESVAQIKNKTEVKAVNEPPAAP